MSSAFPMPERRLGASSFRSMPDMWLHRCQSTPQGEAMIFRRQGEWTTMTWRQAEARSRDIANGLLALGLQPEERCVILSATRPEWVLVDMAILCAGGATTTIYPSHTADETRHIVRDSESVLLFCDTAEQLDKVLTVREDLEQLRHVVVFDEVAVDDEGVLTLADLEARGHAWAAEHPEALEAAYHDIDPERLCTLMYTSGTTGEPKGVRLTHGAWVYEAAAIDALGMVSPADKQYLVLPLSHVFAKVLQVVFIRLGVPTVIDGDTDALIDRLQQTQPTWLGAVPRIFEKAYNRIVTEARAAGGARYALFKWAVSVGRDVSRLRQQRQEPTGLLKAKYALADRLVLSKVKEAFGGRIRFLVSGGAPLSREIAEFFHACDLLILEGYGLTESSAASTINTPDDYRFGTVGRPVPGTEVRIDDDGEVLLHGPGVMQGYHHRPDDTDTCLFEDADGRTWLRTGDIGTLLETGHLQITDRKKEMIVTAGGKNIAPAHFQKLLEARSPWVSRVLMHGDGRPYCVALISIDETTVGPWARAQGIAWIDYADLASRPEVKELVQRDVDAVNAELPSFETVKKFALLPEDLTVDSGALTPSLKIKRRVVEERYRDLLDAFYEGTVRKL